MRDMYLVRVLLYESRERKEEDRKEGRKDIGGLFCQKEDMILLEQGPETPSLHALQGESVCLHTCRAPFVSTKSCHMVAIYGPKYVISTAVWGSKPAFWNAVVISE